MQGTNQKRHAHRRSSSLYQEPAAPQKQEQTTLLSDLNSEVTMKLLEESQIKSQFQLIVDLLHPEHTQSEPDLAREGFLGASAKEKHIGEILSEYFQIQSISFMKNTCRKEEKAVNTYLDLERLENQAKTNSRLRYHRNKKSKAFNSGFQMDFLKNYQDVEWSQNCYKINSCAKA